MVHSQRRRPPKMLPSVGGRRRCIPFTSIGGYRLCLRRARTVGGRRWINYGTGGGELGTRGRPCCSHFGQDAISDDTLRFSCHCGCRCSVGGCRSGVIGAGGC